MFDDSASDSEGDTTETQGTHTQSESAMDTSQASDSQDEEMKCPYCPEPLIESDKGNPIVALKQQRGVDNCNTWAKRRRLDVTVQVSFNVF